jgi:two-component system CheB/CheR fusion protein
VAWVTFAGCDGSRDVVLLRDRAILTARSGAEAIERALASLRHVVIMDLGLPDMDGYAVLEHLKGIDGLGSTRFIALAGRSLPEDLQTMRSAGLFVKPADIGQLLSVLESCGVQP